MANKHTIAAYFSQAMQVIGGNSAPGDIVVKIYIKHEQKFVFVEMGTMGNSWRWGIVAMSRSLSLGNNRVAFRLQF